MKRRLQRCYYASLCFYLNPEWTKPAADFCTLSCRFSGGVSHLCRGRGNITGVKVCDVNKDNGKWAVIRREQLGPAE